jgi:protein-L-isoaspartate O-methyltransferase
MMDMVAGLRQRHIVPEILDGLSADDRDALASRRDLTWINALMLQSWLMAGLLKRHLSAPPKRVLEIGAGDGAFTLSLARRMGSAWRGVELVMVDQADLLTSARREDLAKLGWRVEPIVSDVFAWLAQSGNDEFDVVYSNLFLHHFSSEELRNLSGRFAVAPTYFSLRNRAGTWSRWLVHRCSDSSV